jgi:predicted phosphodiesterase
MFQLNDDLSIYATRGDIVFFSVSAEEDGEKYTFKAGDVVRIKIYGKKNAESVVFEKNFPVTEDTEEVEILLDKEDTKIGDVISKPKDYWYEVELNPFTNPQTLIGYDEDGAKVFKLFPEGADIPAFEPTPEDIPFMDDELDMVSTRPVQNQAVARAVVKLNADVKKNAETVLSLKTELSVERARINNLAKLNEGSTTGDAEVADGRVDYTGKTWDNLGENIRGVSGRLSAKIANVNDRKVSFDELKYGCKHLPKDKFTMGYMAVSTGVSTDNIRGVYTDVFLENGVVVDVTDSDLVGVAVYSYGKNDHVFKNAAEEYATPFTVDSNESCFKVHFYWKDTGIYADIPESRAKELLDYAIVRLTEKSELLSTNENIENINNRLSEIEDGSVNAYYFENNYLPDKVSAINDNMCEVGVDGESFAFITDVHWDLGNAKQSPNLIKHIKKHTNLDCIICGGDIINEGNKAEMRKVFLDFVNQMKDIGLPFPIAYGNHDDNSNAGNPASEYFDNNTVMTLEFKHVLDHITFINPDYDRSFIFDKAETKTRFIFLDTRNNSSLKWETITPFSNALKAVPDGYKVVVVAHWLMGSDSLTGWGKRITDTLDAYNTRGKYTNDQNNVTYDFEESNGECVLIVCGHTHEDISMVTSGGIPVLNTTCDNYNRDISTTVRVVGTITEQAFDVVTMNYKDNSIKVVRIGAGNNRTFANGVWQ